MLQVLKTPVARMYIAATLLTNIMTCYRGNVIFKYFDLEPPSAAVYLSMR